MVMAFIDAMAQFERDLLVERTPAGLERATAEGAMLGRPSTLNASEREAVRAALLKGSACPSWHDTIRRAVMRAWAG